MHCWTTTFLLLHFVMWALSVATMHALDGDGNGFSDVWEEAYGTGLNAAADLDGDGLNNAAEEEAGTNPHDPQERFGVADVQMAPDEMTVTWQSVAGKWYGVQVNPALDGSGWAQVGEAFLGTGAMMTASFPETSSLVQGTITRKRWSFSSNPSLATLKATMAAGTPPSETSQFTAIQTETGNGDMNNYGQYLEGWIIPPTTGEYTFHIASDDNGEFWFCPTPGGTKTVLTCRVTSYTGSTQWAKTGLQTTPESLGQNSHPVQLVAGKPYRFQVYQQNGGGGYNMAVGWKRPGQSSIEVIRNPASGAPVLASGPANSLGDMGLMTEDGFYARLEVFDFDTDGDGLNDYEEHVLGLNYLRAESTARTADATSAANILASPSTLTAGASALRAYEAEQQPGVFTIFRSGGIKPLEIHYVLSGSAVEGTDFPVQTGTVRMPVGARSVDIPILPTSDGLLEPQESVVLEILPNPERYLLGNPQKSTITIDDARDLLFIAPLRTDPALRSPTSGYAALRMAGNRVFATFSLSFTNLTSPQTSAEIYVSPTGEGGTVVKSLALGQVPTLTWAFEPAGGLSTAQITAALEAGQLWIRLGSEQHPAGEARARFLANEGWQNMPTPAAPPAGWAPTLTDADAGRFLIQATFGPTLGDINYLRAMGYQAWLDEQINTVPATLHLPYVQDRRAEYRARNGSDGWQRPRQEAWWEASLNGQDQLRQRMALALSEIFVVSDIGVLDSSHLGLTSWQDMLVQNAFGNYRELLEKVTLSPIMGQYLSMVLNRKADLSKGTEPDENYAREVQQLFSIGLYELNMDGSARLDAEGLPIPTYTQTDISNFARVFTGWGYAGTTNYWKPWPDFEVAEREPMVQFPQYHDVAEKQLHNGVTIPAGLSGEAEMEIAMDNLFHHPNVGPFMARQLIQRFVTSNPSPGYIYRVASVFNDNGDGVRGDLGAVIRAVLMDYEARSPELLNNSGYGKLREPLLRMTHFYRAASHRVPHLDDTWHLPANSAKPARMFLDLSYSMNQAALKSPSVFNFFQPGFIPPGRLAHAGLFGPEFQIVYETSVIDQINLQWDAVSWGTYTPEGAQVTLNFTDEIAILNAIRTTSPLPPIANRFDPLIDHLDKELLAGHMSPFLRQELRDYFSGIYGQINWWNLNNTGNLKQHAQYAYHLVVASPDFVIQR